MSDLDRLIIDVLTWASAYFNLEPHILDLYVGMLIYVVLLLALYAAMVAYYRHRDSTAP